MKGLEVFSNLATSLDGKIATSSREFFILGSPKDLLLLRKLRDSADAIVFGAEVLRAFRRPCLPLRKNHRITNAVLSRDLRGIDPDWPFFVDARIDRVLYISGKLSAARRAKFAERSRIVELKSHDVAKEILRDLSKQGMSKIGVEGGGSVMWEFARQNLIDRYYVTIVPRILAGKGAPTLVDGAGFFPTEVLNLKLEKVRKVGSELFLIYSALGARGHRHPLLK